jgi:mannose-1-phosphate guanylyltransferase
VATIGLHPVDDPSSYGLVRRQDDGEVLGFLEKPEPDQIDTDEVNAGTYVLERAVVDLIPAGRAVSIEREVFPGLVGRGLYGRRLDGYWMDIGTPERYLQATWDILDGRVETDVVASAPGLLVEDGAAVADGAEVGPRAVVRAGCDLGAGARVVDSVLLEGCRVGERAVVDGSILGTEVVIGEGATIGAGSVLGDGAVVEAGAEVPAGARVQPGEVVDRAFVADTETKAPS